MQLLLTLASLLLAATCVSATPLSKRQTASQFIHDRSFENVDLSNEFSQNYSSGHWKFKDQAYIALNYEECSSKKKDPDGNLRGCTPYGSKFVNFYPLNYQPGQKFGSISQSISGLTTGSEFLMSYAYRIDERQASGNCTYTTKFAGQILDVLTIFPSGPVVNDWRTRSFSFAPQISNGTLMLKFYCQQDIQPPNKVYELFLDELSLTGPTFLGSS